MTVGRGWPPMEDMRREGLRKPYPEPRGEKGSRRKEMAGGIKRRKTGGSPGRLDDGQKRTGGERREGLADLVVWEVAWEAAQVWRERELA
ncbi:hypothetical protein NL676_008729 [Syzygium grande]|nr:hypothetical protein NL676_008729 [Syzygium grande]